MAVDPPVRDLERQLYEHESRLAAIGRTTRVIGHELRNSLTIVKGYSELAHRLACQGEASALLVEALERVREAADRLGTGVDEILELIRDQSPQLVLECISAGALIEEVVAMLEPVLQADASRLETDLRLPEGAEVMVDRRRMLRVSEELMDNSRRALLASEAPGRVLLSAAVEGRDLVVRMADSGTGIAEELAGRLFRPRAASRNAGKGLGLATVRSTIRAHGGDVDVELETVEGGAAFTIRLPLSEELGAVRAGQSGLPGLADETPSVTDDERQGLAARARKGQRD